MRHKTDPRTATGKYNLELRRFPHANSLRTLASRFREDAKEVSGYTSVPIRLRNGNFLKLHPGWCKSAKT